MRIRALPVVLLTATALGVGTLTASSAQGAPTTAAAASHRPTVPPVALLTQQQTDVLGAPIAYPTQTPAQASSSIITLVPGQSTGRHKHDAPMYAYVVSGTLTVAYDGGVTKVYPAGQAIMEAVGVWHEGTNRGHSVVKVLVVNIGADGVANTVKP